MKLPIVKLRKNYKRNRILSTIRYGKNVSRYDVKKATNYSMTTVLNVINDLVENKFVNEEECDDSRVGRKPIWLKINPDGGYFIGVDFNVNKLNCVVINFSGDVIFHKNYKKFTDVTVESIIDKIKKSINEALEFLKGNESKVMGIGIGAPGFVDKEKGISVEYSNLKNWDNIPICQILEEEFKYKVLIENNVNIMAIAYRWMKYEETSDDFILLSIRHGIKMSMVLNNKLFYGNNGNAGEIAHIKIGNSNRPCPCGKNGCLDTEVSFRGIKNKIIEGIFCGRFNDIQTIVGDNLNDITEEIFINSVENGYPDSVKLLKEAAEYLGKAMSMVVATIDPKKIILTGHIVSDTSDIFIEQVQDTINSHFTKDLGENLKVLALKTDDNIGAVGAALMIMEDEFEVMDKNI